MTMNFAPVIIALSFVASGCTSLAPDFMAQLGSVVLTRACPDGWQANTGGCDAILPDAGCAVGTMPVIGQTTCAPVGHTMCGPGFMTEPSGWGCTEVMPVMACTGATLEVLGKTDCQPVGDCDAAFPPAGATLFVDASYTSAQLDATHFATIAAAIVAAQPDAIIAIEEGTYVGPLSLSHSVTLAGRCAQEVTVQGAANASDPGLLVNGGVVTASGLTFSGHFNGAVIETGATLNLEAVVLSANAITGIQDNGTLVVSDSVIRDGVPDSTGDWGVGIYMANPGSVALHRTVIAHNAKAGIVAQGRNAALTVDAAIIRDTRPAGDGTNGIGIVVYDGATATLTGSVLAANGEAGVAVEGQTLATKATVDGCVIRDTVPLVHPIVDPMNPNNLEYHGINLEVMGTATVDVTNTTLLRSGGSAVVVTVAPAAVTLTDSTVFVSRPFPNGYGTSGIISQANATVTLTRAAVVQASSVGIQVYGSKSTVTLTDSLVAQTLALGSDPLGQGVAIGFGGSVNVQHSAITQSAGSGVYMSTADAGISGSCTVDSSVLAYGTGFSNGTFGRGLELNGAATVTITSSAVVGNREVGVVISDPGTNVLIANSVVRDTACDGMGNSGRAVNVQQGAHLELDDSLLINNHDLTLLAGSPNTTVLVQRTIVANSLARTNDGHFGLGVAALEGGRLDLKSTQVINSADIGVAVAASAATLASCDISNNAVGIQVQDGSMLQQVSMVPMTIGPLDVLVTDDTTFEGNATRIGTGSVPLPEQL